MTEDFNPAYTRDKRARETSFKSSTRYRKHRRRKLLRNIGVPFLAIVLLVGIGSIVLGRQVISVRSQLEQTMRLASDLRTELGAGDIPAAQRTFEVMEQKSAVARSTSTGPIWRAASALPVIGANFAAVTEVAVSADDVVKRAVGPLLTEYGALDFQALAPADGEIDIAPIQKAAPKITTAANTVRLSHERLASVNLANLMPQVATPLDAATQQLSEIKDALAAASSVAQLMPAMLGAEGPRDYLILIQNTAEVRATGGIPGALAILHTDNGKISLGEQSSAGAIKQFVPPLDVDPQQESLYTARLGTQMQNVNLTPDFPTAAETAKRMWEERHQGQNVDGVLALDPVVLSHLLGATGPVALEDPEVLRVIENTSLPKSLDSENVIPTLLHEVYQELQDPEIQDAYFAAVAARVFDTFATGQGDASQLLRAFTASTDEHRLYLWSSHSDEQSIIASTAVAGSVTGAEAGGATFGVYFNDGTGAKMDYHVTRTVQLVQTCQTDGYRNYTVRITATNNAPLDAESSLPKYVTGDGVFGVQPGRVRTNYVVYGPTQSLAETATLDGEPAPLGSGKHGQRPVATLTEEIGPGESAVMDVIFTGVVQNSAPRLVTTPTVQDPKDVVLPLKEDASCE